MAAAKRLDYIDGWRVVAILLVFTDHLGINHMIGAFDAASRFGVVSQYSERGVYLYFSKSGYVVSLGALREARRG